MGIPVKAVGKQQQQEYGHQEPGTIATTGMQAFDFGIKVSVNSCCSTEQQTGGRYGGNSSGWYLED